LKTNLDKAASGVIPTSMVTSTSVINASTKTTFPLMSKRPKLQQKKAIATALESSTSAWG